MQAGAYQNGTWVVGVAKAGVEEGVELRSAAAASSRRPARSLAGAARKGDEIALARCDLDLCNSYKATIFNFDQHREPGLWA